MIYRNKFDEQELTNKNFKLEDIEFLTPPNDFDGMTNCMWFFHESISTKCNVPIEDIGTDIRNYIKTHKDQENKDREYSLVEDEYIMFDCNEKVFEAYVYLKTAIIEIMSKYFQFRTK
jgi:hypothetical protein